MTQTPSQSSISANSTLDIEQVAAGTARIACNGGGGALGHPQVWLTLTPAPHGGTAVTCPYCSRQFEAPAS